VPYVDTQTIHNPATGTVAPATWGDQVRDNLEFLVDPPVCSISDTSAAVASGLTPVVLGATATENFDNDAMHSNVTNRSRITIQTAGRYLFLGSILTDSYLGAGNAFFRITFRIDGSTAIGGAQLKRFDNITEAVRLTAARSLVLSASQYVELTCTQNNGGSINVTLDELVAIYLTR
jgi:hypothetical protein